MKRFHALEWEDLPWFPGSWRDYGTDYLRFVATKFDIYKPILPVLKKGLDAGGAGAWVDCASGGGGGLINLARYLKTDYPDLKITLTDFYPNIRAFERTQAAEPGIFGFEREPVNAMGVPPHLQGKFRTMFGSFHHFRPDEARRILQNAVDTNSPVAVFEPVGKNAMSFISMVFVIFNVIFFTPFIRPLRFEVLPFIYLLPVIPLYIVWDGIASILRTYSEKELRELITGVNGSDRFRWETGKAGNPLMPVYYLLGVPN